MDVSIIKIMGSQVYEKGLVKLTNLRIAEVLIPDLGNSSGHLVIPGD